MKFYAKKLPKSVMLFLGLLGFYIGTMLHAVFLVIATFDVVLSLLAWGILFSLTMLMLFVLQWKYNDTLQEWLPFLKEKKKQ